MFTTLETLLAKGAAVDEVESLRGTTALMWAAAYAHPQAVRVLIANGADVAARSRRRCSRPGVRILRRPRASAIDEFLNGTGARGAAVVFKIEELPRDPWHRIHSNGPELDR